MIDDGKHIATLFDLTFCMTSAGTPAASFVWETSDGTERTSYVLALTDQNGRTNHFGIQLTRRWARGWDGINLNWFRDNREALLGTPALLTVRDGRIEWISPVVVSGGRGAPAGTDGRAGSPLPAAAGTDGRAGSPLPAAADQQNGEADSCPLVRDESGAKRRVHIDLIVDQSKLAQLPERIEPNFEEAKSLFDAITEGTAKLDADKVWTLIAKKVGPMQIDFGEAEWQLMIDRIRQLKSWSGLVSW